METSFVKDVPSHNSTLLRADKALVKRNIIRTSQVRNSQVIDSVDFKKKPDNQPKGYCFWALVFAVSIIAIANFFLTVTIFSVLSLTKSMKSIEVFPAANLIKFFGNFEMDNLIKSDGIISGFSESPIAITSRGSDINFKVDNTVDSPNNPLLNIGQESVEFLNLDSFDVYEPKKMVKSSAFSTTFPNFELPKGVESLYIQKASVNRITSGLDMPLSFDASTNSSILRSLSFSIDRKRICVHRGFVDYSLFRTVAILFQNPLKPPAFQVGYHLSRLSQNFFICCGLPSREIFIVAISLLEFLVSTSPRGDDVFPLSCV
uniref:Beta-sarcoglycan n=1 Tax=Evadne anonyx TaxID=141404 RepID=A0A9N6WQK5_9CRUS|nr:EOG090X0F7H [Evadne anonyx]